MFYLSLKRSFAEFANELNVVEHQVIFEKIGLFDRFYRLKRNQIWKLQSILVELPHLIYSFQHGSFAVGIN